MTKKLILMLVLVSMVTSYAGAVTPLGSGLVAYWKFNDDATDATGTYNGVLEGGAGFTTGVFGSALAANNDGVTEYVSIANSGEIEGDWSVQCWVYYHSASTGGLLAGEYMSIRMGQYQTTSHTGLTNTYNIEPVEEGDPLRCNVNGAWDGQDSETTDFAVPTDRWVHLVYVKSNPNPGDPNSENCELFADGDSQGKLVFNETRSSGGNSKDPEQPALWFILKWARIGSLISYDNFGSTIADYDEVAIWDRALTTDDVAALYNSGTGQEISQVLASAPSPADGEINVDLNADLSWTSPGVAGETFDVYFGTTTPATTKVSSAQAETTWILAPLSPNTEYHWRVDTIDPNEGGPITYTGAAWNFTTSPPTASNPYPADQAVGVELNLVMSWDAGIDGGGSPADSHTIFFDPNELRVIAGDAAVKVSDSQLGTTLDAGTITMGEKYFWRVDENYSGGPVAGDVWEFTFSPNIDCDRPRGDLVDPTGTFSYDCLVTLADFAAFASHWLDCGYQNEDCPAGYIFIPRPE